MDQTFMKTKPVLSLLLSMSLPMVLSMMVNSLYNIVDSFYVAQISEDAMNALSLVYPVQNLINAVTIGFSIGINAAISYYLGAGKNKEADIAATQGTLCNAIHGIILTVGCIAIMPTFLGMFTTDGVVLDLGLRYSRIAFSFSVVISFSMSFEKIFQSVGKMMITMISMLCGCITNIILDPMLIFGIGIFPEMGIDGAALATGIGQTLSLIIYIIVYIKKPLNVHLSRKYVGFSGNMCRRLYIVGIPAALNLALPSLLISALNIILSAYSQMYVVVLGVYYKLQTFLYLPANGIVQGMRPLVGYNFGAEEHGRVKKIYKTAMILAAAIMIVGTILCWAIPDQLFGLFSSNEQTIQAGAEALRIISIGFVVSTVSVISSGALEGLSMGVASLIISLLRYAVLTIPAAFILSRFLEAAGVWHAFWVSELITAIIAYFIYYRKTSAYKSIKK
jgi:putative MATE family efflux protein